MGIYGFRGGPVYAPGNPQQRLLTALDQPLSPLSTAGGSAAEAWLQGLPGTAVRDFATPTTPTTPGADRQTLMRQFPLAGVYDAARNIFGAKATGASMDEPTYKASAYYRDSIPWDQGMTEDRAAALALQADTKAVREYFGKKQPVAAFLGTIAGSALDPINYIPTVGPLVKAAAIAKFGRIGGMILSASLDAAANVGVANALTASTRARFGDDVSWQSQVSDIAMAAMIGGVFGLGEGVLSKVHADRAVTRDLAVKAALDRYSTLKRTQEARIALNDGAVSLALDGEIKLTPNGTDPLSAFAREIIPDVVRDGEPRRPAVSGESAPAAAPARTDAAPAVSEPAAAPVQRSTETRIGNAEKAISGLEEALNNLRTGAANVPASMKRPVIDMLKKMGGVHPQSPLADELRALGVTSKSAPGLYRTEGGSLRSVDNIPMAEMPERFAGRVADDGNGYIPQQSWIDAVGDEVRGEPWLTPAEQRRVDEVRKPAADLDEFMNRFGIDHQGRSNADVIADIKAVERRLTDGFDATPGRPERSLTDDEINDWEKRAREPETSHALNAAFRLDPATGHYLEEGDIRQLEHEGRLSDEDRAALLEAEGLYLNGSAYGEALKAAVTCLL